MIGMPFTPLIQMAWNRANEDAKGAPVTKTVQDSPRPSEPVGRAKCKPIKAK